MIRICFGFRRCPHCQLTENGLGKPGGMEKHYAKYCKVMTSCKYCMKLTMVLATLVLEC